MGWLNGRDDMTPMQEADLYWAYQDAFPGEGRSFPAPVEPDPEPFEESLGSQEWAPRNPAVVDLPPSERPDWVIAEDTDGYPFAVARWFEESWAQGYYLNAWLSQAATADQVESLRADGWPVYG